VDWVGESGAAGGGRGVLEGAFLVLDVLAQRHEAGLSALAAASGLPKATAHRLLGQLVELGAVERQGARYRVGYRMLRVGQTWQPYPGLGEAAQGPLRALTRVTGAIAAVCVLRGGRTVLVAGAQGTDTDDPAPAPGTVLPWPTAAGKALVATSRAAGALAAGSPASWARQAEQIRASGVAVNPDESTSGVFCLATPIRDARGETIAALGVRATQASHQTRLTEALHRASAAIATALPAAPNMRPAARE
jgi:DNA-binding IclR family transcriptional regulator